jgi:phasin family protein
MMTAEQMMSAYKSHVDTLFGLSNKVFEGGEKLLELNVQLARTVMAEAAENAKAALSAKDAQEFLAVQTNALHPTAEKAAAYSRQMYDAIAATNAEVSKVAEATGAEMQTKVAAIVDSMVKNAPAGSENAVALVKSTMAAANNAFEGAQKAAKQASDVAEASFQAMSTSATKAAQSASAAAAKVKRAA